jgi:hypothetical protein
MKAAALYYAQWRRCTENMDIYCGALWSNRIKKIR